MPAQNLAAMAKTTGANFETPYTAAISAIDSALGAINAKVATPPAPARLAYLVLNVAAGEYGGAFGGAEDGEKITAAVEYQDSLGFYRQARALIEANASAFHKRDAIAYGQVITHLNLLKTTWPSAAVPTDAVLSASRFQSEVLTLTGLLKGFE